jgi:hypothetical protein
MVIYDFYCKKNNLLSDNDISENEIKEGIKFNFTRNYFSPDRVHIDNKYADMILSYDPRVKFR